MAKTVLITGASSGFGKEAALLFKSKGWNVAATMRSPEDAEWVTAHDIFTTKLDVTHQDSINTAIRTVLDRFGAIDVLVNNAGFALMGPLEGATAADVKRQFDTNVVGLIAVTQAVLPSMRKTRRGIIVNLSSVAGRVSLPLLAAYSATKFAIEGLTESLQYELAPHGIRVKLIEPGGANTDFAGRSMTRTLHPAYATMTAGIRSLFNANKDTLPGPEIVAATIFAAATDGTKRLRYPVATKWFLPARRVLGASGWRILMDAIVRRATRTGASLGADVPAADIKPATAPSRARDTRRQL